MPTSIRLAIATPIVMLAVNLVGRAISPTPPDRARVQSAVKGVQTGERLFSSLVFEYSERIRDLTGASKKTKPADLVLPATIFWQDAECLVVKQKSRFYYKASETEESAKGKSDNLINLGYDGVTLRCTRYRHLNGEPGGYANIITGQTPDVPWALDPYQLGFRCDGKPLSGYLVLLYLF
jgi:hypothetical protein